MPANSTAKTYRIVAFALFGSGLAMMSIGVALWALGKGPAVIPPVLGLVGLLDLFLGAFFFSRSSQG